MQNLAALKSSFSGDIVTPSDPDYSVSLLRWAVNSQRRAGAVAFVKSPADVALAIAFARQHKISIAVCGGGHSATGASSTKGGLVIDLSRYLNHVRVDPKAKLAYVGGGAVWEKVEKEAIKYGLACIAPAVNHTGVGGFTLGGGYGFLSARHGLAIDNLVQATVVTASGATVTTNASSNPDLFFAIRGGGGNFGVVTEFVYHLHPQRRTVFTGHLIYKPEALQQIIQATNEWLPTAGKDEGMIEFVTIGPDGKPVVVCAPFFNGSEADGRKKFQKFLNIGPIKDLAKEVPFEAVNAISAVLAPVGQGYHFQGVAQRSPDFSSIAKVQSRVTDIFNKYHTGAGPGFQPIIIFEYFSVQNVNSVPPQVTAFRRDLTPNIVVLMKWKPTTTDGNFGEGEKRNVATARAYAEEISNLLKAGQQKAGLSQTQALGYANYDPDATGESASQRAKMHFGGNYRKLQAVKAKYDPEGFFNKWLPISPA